MNGDRCFLAAILLATMAGGVIAAAYCASQHNWAGVGASVSAVAICFLGLVVP